MATPDKITPENFSEVERAAERGDLEAQFLLGIYFSGDDGGPPDNDASDRWTRQAAAGGYPPALHRLAKASFAMESAPPELQAEAFAHCQEAALKDYAPAQFLMGIFFAEGFGVEKNDQTAFKWYLKAAEAGEPWAIAAIGVAYNNGLGVTRDFSKALEWFIKGTTVGEVFSMFSYGTILFEGVQTPKNREKGLDLIMEAASKDFSPAQIYLGRLYYIGKDIARDPDIGFNYLREASQNGDDEATAFLSYYLLNDANYPKKVKLALRFLKEEAKLGNPIALLGLAVMSASGHGLPQDGDRALTLIKISRDLGYEPAGSLLKKLEGMEDPDKISRALSKIISLETVFAAS
ncbi:MAG: sel1 repeat family protein [Deltaproteobacteria bacterium]|jgi:TPR repeat protein|nr:sel1 repeat family protein [Deltaproteobacteria bacterium]